MSLSQLLSYLHVLRAKSVDCVPNNDMLLLQPSKRGTNNTVPLFSSSVGTSIASSSVIPILSLPVFGILVLVLPHSVPTTDASQSVITLADGLYMTIFTVPHIVYPVAHCSTSSAGLTLMISVTSPPT